MFDMLKLAKLASGGPGAIAPILASAMPNVVQTIAMQRAASQLAERAANLSRACGDVLAVALANGSDCAAEHMAGLRGAADAAQTVADTLDAAARNPASTDDIKRLYGFRP